MPFYLLGLILPNQATAYFRMAGGMTLFNIVEIFQKTATLPAGLEFLGYIWIPALLLGYYAVYRNPPKSMNELVMKAVGLLLIFFLTRSWLSEPNINLLLPLLLITTGFEKISLKTLHLAWIIPLVFIVLNYAFSQLFFLVYPPIIPAMGAFDAQFGTARLVARFAVTVLWYILASRILVQVMPRK